MIPLAIEFTFRLKSAIIAPEGFITKNEKSVAIKTARTTWVCIGLEEVPKWVSGMERTSSHPREEAMPRNTGNCISAGKPGLGDPAPRLPATRTQRQRSSSSQAASSPRSCPSLLRVSMANVNSSGRHRRGTEISLGGGSGARLAPPLSLRSPWGASPPAG